MEIRGPAQLLNLDPLRLLEGQAALLQALARPGGSEIEALLAARLPEGLLLELLTGQMLQAAGDLPFPEGTKLRLRVVPDAATGTLRLEPREATPPPPRPLLAPLEQGEAAPLLRRLQAPGPLPLPLEVLKAVLVAGGWDGGSGAASGFGLRASGGGEVVATLGSQGPPQPAAAGGAMEAHGPRPTAHSLPPHSPQPSQLASALAALGIPQEEAEAWSHFLSGEPVPLPASPTGEGPAPQVLRQTLQILRSLPHQVATAPDPPPSPLPSQPPGSTAEIAEEDPLFPASFASSAVKQGRLVIPSASALPGAPEAAPELEELRKALVPEALLPRMLPLLLLSRLPDSAATPLEQLFRALLPQIPLAEPKPEPASPKGKPGPPETPRSEEGTAPSPKPQARPGAPGAPEARSPAPEARSPKPEAPTVKPEALFHSPEPWESLLKSATQALTHPESSPREAPFHALQAREGTALFELPLPFPGFQGALELWVEADGEGPEGEREVRLLLALDMEGTGPLRLGFSAVAGTVRAQVWTEEAKAPGLARALEQELGNPPPFPVQVKAFQGPQPTLRRLAGAGGFGAMG